MNALYDFLRDTICLSVTPLRDGYLLLRSGSDVYGLVFVEQGTLRFQAFESEKEARDAADFAASFRIGEGVPVSYSETFSIGPKYTDR